MSDPGFGHAVQVASTGEPMVGGFEQPEFDVPGPVFDEGLRSLAGRIVARYPDGRSALVPLLYLVQSRAGWVPHQGMREVAEILGLKTAEVEAVATFYTMLKLRPCGRYVISVCTNPSCALLGGDRLLERAREIVGPGSEHRSVDGLFTVEEEECLAACDKAPVVTLNYIYYDRVTEAWLEDLVARIREGELPPEAPRGAGVPGDLREVSRLLAGAAGLDEEPAEVRGGG